MPKPKRRHSKTGNAGLTAGARARLFAQLATLERAGIPLLQALPILAREIPSLQSQIDILMIRLQRGEPLSEAGQKSGLLRYWEARLIGVAVEAGNLQETFARLSDFYEIRARHWRTLKSRLIFPAAILVIAVFVTPLPDLILGSIGAGGYMARTVLPLILGIGVIQLIIIMGRRLSASPLAHPLARLLLALPVVGGLIRQRQQRDLLTGLAMLLEAGVPAVEALRLAADSVANPILRDRFAGAAAAVEEGLPVAAGLQRYGAVDSAQAADLIATGEVSGKLDETLRRHGRELERSLDLRMAYIGEWLPRIVYAVVVGFVIGTLL